MQLRMIVTGLEYLLTTIANMELMIDGGGKVHAHMLQLEMPESEADRMLDARAREIVQLQKRLVQTGLYLCAGAQTQGLDPTPLRQALGLWKAGVSGDAVTAAAKRLHQQAATVTVKGKAPKSKKAPAVQIVGVQESPGVYCMPRESVDGTRKVALSASPASTVQSAAAAIAEFDATGRASGKVLQRLSQKSIAWQAALKVPQKKTKRAYRKVA